MSNLPPASIWADEISDDEDPRSNLIKTEPSSYQATHQQHLRDHEEGLNRLGETIRRQRNIAHDLATEVDLHNEIIDDIDTGLTTANVNVQKNTRNIKLLTKKSSTFYLWFIIVVLGIAIVLLAIL